MSNSEVGRKFTFWVVYDATGDRQFVKMDSDTGCLAMFDNEESAAAFASGLFGVGYKEVVLYSCPQPDVAELVEALRAVIDEASSVYGYVSTETVLRAIDALADRRKQGGES